MQQKRHIRHKRIRAKIKGTTKVPRLSVFRSNKHIYSQLIDDEKKRTLASAGDQEITNPKHKTQKQKIQPKSKKLGEGEIIRSGKIALAHEVGKLIAQKALKEKIEKAVFDRAGYKYHGRVRALAEGAREGGLKF